jgi:hypothetical protein
MAQQRWVSWGHCANCGRDLIVFPAGTEVSPEMSVLGDILKGSLYAEDELPSMCRYCQHQFNPPSPGPATPERWWRTQV